MKKIGLWSSLMAALSITMTPVAQSQELYWATSGTFGPFNIQGLLPTYPEAKQVTMPVSMWILKHPKGLVVFDTGNNAAVSDGLDNCKKYWAAGLCDFLHPNQNRSDVIDMQLKKLGYTTNDVKVVVTSHTHLDHAGNMGMFPKAIHVIQKKELYQGWWPEKFQGRTQKGVFVMADIAAAREFNYLELDGEYDLFGDGTVKLFPTPGHTIGHQSMKVKLPKTGTVILAQDAVSLQENLDGGYLARTFSVQAYLDSLNRIKMMRDLEGAQILMSHDANQFAKMGDRWYK